MALPKITIITASFNSEKTIAQTIQSVLDQRYDNIEYLIIDGASTDNTVAIIKSFEGLFEGRLNWISEKDAGIYYAWNKALTMATGDWLSFVGSDDILKKDAIQNYMSAIKSNPTPLNFISSRIMLVKQNLDLIRITGKPWGEKMKTYSCIPHVGALHHKSLFEKKGTFNTDYLISADYDFLLRCSDVVNPGYIPTVTAMVREGGISGRQISRVAKETLQIKIANNCKSKWVCILDYYVAILKFQVRTKLVNKLSVLAFKQKHN